MGHVLIFPQDWSWLIFNIINYIIVCIQVYILSCEFHDTIVTQLSYRNVHLQVRLRMMMRERFAYS